MGEKIKENKLSVIIPVYNIEKKTLCRCVESIIKQDVSIEVILVDDGSNDTCCKLCDELTEQYINLVVIHQENSGVSSARNKGLSYANGEYITFVDADDWVEDGMYSKMLSYAERNDFDIVISGSVRDYKGIIKNNFSCDTKILLTSEEVLCELLKKEKFLWGPWDKIFKKECIKNIFFDDNYAMGEDLDFVWRSAKRSNSVLFLPLYKYHYCFRSDSVTAKINSVKKNDAVLVMKKILIDCKKNYPALVEVSKGLLIKEMSSMIMQAYVEDKCKMEVREYQKYIRNNYSFLLQTKNLSIAMKMAIFFLSCNYMLGLFLIKLWKLSMKIREWKYVNG